MKIVLYGEPRTKKNSSRIIYNHRTGKRLIVPSEAYSDYEKDCLKQITGRITETPPYNVRCLYYIASKRKTDLVNLLEATDDILVRSGLLADDNSRVIAGHDGSRVLHDKEEPRAEIYITELRDPPVHTDG